MARRTGVPYLVGMFQGLVASLLALLLVAAAVPPVSATDAVTVSEDVQAEELAMTGWLNAHLAFEGLLAAGPEFDRAKVVGALRATDDYTAEGMSNAIDWSRQIPMVEIDTPEADYEQECFNGVQVQDGEFVPWSGTEEEPWVCFDLPRDEWVEPELRSFVG